MLALYELQKEKLMNNYLAVAENTQKEISKLVVDGLQMQFVYFYINRSIAFIDHNAISIEINLPVAKNKSQPQFAGGQ